MGRGEKRGVGQGGWSWGWGSPQIRGSDDDLPFPSARRGRWVMRRLEGGDGWPEGTVGRGTVRGEGQGEEGRGEGRGGRGEAGGGQGSDAFSGLGASGG